MIEFKKGNIFEEDVEALVNTVNCVGVMGRGVALQFKNKYPENYKKYLEACKRNIVVPGKMFIYKKNELFNPKYIINFPTKRHWKYKSKIEDIENGLDDLKKIIKKLSIKSIAIPPLGSGLGGLNWIEVKNIIIKKLQNIDCKIIVFEPLEEKIEKVNNRKVPKMTSGSATLIGLVDRYIQGMMDPFITLLEVHKLMYFLQESGEDLKLRYKKAIYGPYAENLKYLMNRIEGYFIRGYEDGVDNPEKKIELMPGALEEAKMFLKNKIKTKKRFDKVSQLIEGFETPFGLELLATVHWIVKEIKSIELEMVSNEVYKWNEIKKKFTKRQIKIAIDRLKECGFIKIVEYNK